MWLCSQTLATPALEGRAAHQDSGEPSLIVPSSFPDDSAVKSPSAKQRTCVWSLGQEDPLEKGMATTPVILPGKSHGQRSLVGCSPCSQRRVRHDLASKYATRSVIGSEQERTRRHREAQFPLLSPSQQNCHCLAVTPSVTALGLSRSLCFCEDEAYLTVCFKTAFVLTQSRKKSLDTFAIWMSPPCNQWGRVIVQSTIREIRQI